MRHGVTGRGGLRWVSAQSLVPAAPSLPGLSPAGRCPMTTAPSTALVTIQPTFTDRRADIECFARDLEARGRARATVTRRLSTIAGFYRYAVEEEILDHSPAAHVRRPRLDYESHATALDRNELGACWWPRGSARRPSMR